MHDQPFIHHSTEAGVSILLTVLSLIPTAFHLSGITEWSQEWLPVFQILAAIVAIMLGIKALLKKNKDG